MASKLTYRRSTNWESTEGLQKQKQPRTSLPLVLACSTHLLISFNLSISSCIWRCLSLDACRLTSRSLGDLWWNDLLFNRPVGCKSRKANQTEIVTSRILNFTWQEAISWVDDSNVTTAKFHRAASAQKVLKHYKLVLSRIRVPNKTQSVTGTCILLMQCFSDML